MEENEIIGRRKDSLVTRLQGSFTTLATSLLQPPCGDLSNPSVQLQTLASSQPSSSSRLKRSCPPHDRPPPLARPLLSIILLLKFTNSRFENPNPSSNLQTLICKKNKKNLSLMGVLAFSSCLVSAFLLLPPAAAPASRCLSSDFRCPSSPPSPSVLDCPRRETNPVGL